MDVVKFTETIFSNQDKKGVIAPDADGYYTLVMGGLNTYNSAGEYYIAEGVVQMFEASSHFMRRIRNGALFAEVGHPKRAPGMGLEEFYRRIVTVDETNVCAHIAELWLDFNFGKNHPEIGNADFVAIMGKVKGAGPKSSVFDLSISNPKQNTAFSVRGITENKERNGRTERKLTEIITFDHVNEPGIAAACKAFNPGLESFQVTELSDTYVDKDILRQTLLNLEKDPMLATESNRALYSHLLSSLKPSSAALRARSW